MDHLRTVIIHGKKAHADESSPRKGREYAELWTGYMGGHEDWTRRFDPHPVEHCAHYPDGIKGRRPEVWETYKALPAGPRPVYLLGPHAEVPASFGYPLEFVQNKLGMVPCKRLTCTVDMQIALALAEGKEHIILHNIGLITDDWETTALNPEWQMRHKGILYWIGLAEERLRLSGFHTPVTIEGDSIFAPQKKVYGFETCGRDFSVVQRRYFTKGRK